MHDQEKRLDEEKRNKMSLEASKLTMEKQQQKLAKALVQQRRAQEEKTNKDLNSLRLKYLAREEKYMLDGDRDELRTIRRQLEELRYANLTNTRSHNRVQLAQKSSSPQQPEDGELPVDMSSHRLGTELSVASREVSRLKQERNDLVNSQAYPPDHYIVQELDRRIHVAEEARLHLL